MISAMLLYGAVGTALAQPPSPSITRAPYEQASSDTSRTEPSHEPAPVPDEPERHTDPANYEHACQNPEGAEEADLCQQWRMAEASEELVTLADRQFWATIVEIGALIMTVCFTAWAALAASRAASASNVGAIATQKAAEAAIEANQTSKEATIITNRAWLFLDDAQVSAPLQWQGHKGKIAITLAVSNYGQTPAFNVEIYDKIHVGSSAHAHKIYSDMSRKVREQPTKWGTMIRPGREMQPKLILEIPAADVWQWLIDFDCNSVFSDSCCVCRL